LLKRVPLRGFWYMYEQSKARWWVCIIAISYVLFVTYKRASHVILLYSFISLYMFR
jgi:hypothetical protein